MASSQSTTSIQQTSHFPQVAVKRHNNPSIGFEFEDEVIVSLICTLEHNEGLVREMVLPDDKLNDIVIVKDVTQSGSQTEYEYRFYQLKHKAHQNETITWSSLISDAKDKLYLGTYYKSYEKLKKIKFPNKKEVIKEICIMTNAGLASSNSTGVTSLKSITNQWAQQRQGTHYITNDHVATYFSEEKSKSLFMKILKGERFKFSQKGIHDVTECFFPSVNRVPHVKAEDFKQFLKLLVFHVKVTSATELKEDNNTFLRMFFPFHWDDANRELRNACCEVIKTRLLAPFAEVKTTGEEINWVDIKGRSSSFNQYRESFEAHPFVSGITGFDKVIGKKLLEEFKLLSDNASPWLTQDMITDFRSTQEIGERQLTRVLNIRSGGSNSEQTSSTQALALKAYAMLRNESLHFITRTIQVENEEGINNIINYLTELEKQARDFKELITERLCCIIAFSENFEEVNSSKIMQKLLKCLATSQTAELRRWIQFIIVTQSALPTDGHERKQVFESVNDTLKWQQLSPGTMNWLLEKTLYVDENNVTETTLKALGFDEKNTGEWMHPRALSELIVHCKEKPLSLALPKKDTVLETDYIERQVHLPLVRYNLEKEKEMLFTCDENNFNCNTPSAAQIPEYQHLLSPVASNRYKDACLWVEAKNGKSILALKHSVVRSKDSDYAISETLLLEDNVNFGTGSTDNKLLVVVDYPGKGKSCLLAKLSNRFLDERSSKYSNHLLLFVSLREIANWGEPKNGLEFLLDHSKALYKDSKSGNANLTRAIINKKCTSGPSSVFVLLDGYDEIKDTQRESTLSVIDYIKKQEGIKRIILTSRPEVNLESELEQRFHQFSLHLKNFDRRDQICYLTKRWMSKAAGTVSEATIKEFAEELVEFAGNRLRDEEKNFLDIPLQCWIFSECFFEQLKQYATDGSDKVPQFEEESFELLSLYDRFYEAKIDVLFEEKADIRLDRNETTSFIRTEIKGSFLKSMERLSVIHMMGLYDAENVCSLSWDDYGRGLDGCKDSSEFSTDLRRAIKLGVVQGSAEKEESLYEIKPQDFKFLHRTFAEYFFAKYLISNFSHEKSKLLDGTFFMNQETVKKTCELVTEKVIFGNAEFAGVRRFFDRMLAKHVPPVGELCPFAKEERSKVLKKFPVIAHERFNEHFAKSIILKNEIEYEKLSFPSNKKASEISEEDYERLRAHLFDGIVHERSRRIVMKDGHYLPCITAMLVHCIKEYATSEKTSDEDREILAYSFVLALVGDRGFHFLLNEKRRREIIFCLLHWFDPAKELPTAANNMFSKWFFICFNASSRNNEEFYQNLIVLACETLEYHRNDPDFDDNVFGIVSTRLFEMAPDGNSEIYAKRFFEVDLSNIEFWLRPRKIRITDRLFKGILVSLNNKDVLSRALLRRLADVLTDKLRQHTKLVAENLITLNQLCDSLNSAHIFEPLGILKEKMKSYEKSLLGNVVRPYAFNEIVNFFLNAHIQGKPEDATVKLLNVSLEYIKTIQNLLFNMNNHVDLSYAIGIGDNLETKVLFNGKVSSISIMLSYFIIADKILDHLSDPDEKSRAMQKIFFSEIGRKSLVAYARTKCCCRCMDESFTGFGIHFLKSEIYDKSINEQFGSLFSNKLEFLWKERGEIAFIDFMLRKDGTKSESDSSRQTGYFIRKLKEAVSNLRKVHLANLPCLLFSDLISEYIPQKLSETGLQYLMNTLEKLPLIFCGSLCFPERSYFFGDCALAISDMKMSLFDGLVRNDVAPSHQFKCKERSAQIEALREALQKVAQPLVSSNQNADNKPQHSLN